MDIPSAKSLNRRNIPFYLAGALLLLGMKYYYSRGDPDSLSWILAPTARWVSALSGIPFIKVPQTGYVSHSCRFIIAASCSGLQFLMISMTALVFSYIHRMRTIKGKIGWMALSALASYLLTILSTAFVSCSPSSFPYIWECQARHGQTYTALHGQKRPEHPAQHRPGPGAYGSRQNSFIPSLERLFTLPPSLPSASWENTSPGNVLLLPEHPTGETAGSGPDFTT